MNLTAKSQVTIHAAPHQVWAAITRPELVKKYMMGADVKSDWKVGSPLIYTGEYEGKPFEEKGIIQNIEREKLLQATHFSTTSGKEDTPENYAVVTWQLDPKEGSTMVTVSQDSIPNQNGVERSKANWATVLEGLRATVEDQSSETELRAGIDERVRAVRAKDVDGLMSSYASDVLTFDIVTPLENKGRQVVRRRVVEWFSSFETPIDYELRDIELTVAGDLAFDHHLTRVRGTSKAGANIDMWFRETIGYRKVDGRWRITHQHSSVPFDMTTGKARLDLAP